MYRYKAVLSNKHFYEEVFYGDTQIQTIRIGTYLDCNPRLHKEWFEDEFWIEICGCDGNWSTRCSENVFFYSGDVVKLSSVVLEGTDVLNVRYVNNNNEAFTVEIFLDYDDANSDLRKKIAVSSVNRITIGTQSSDDIILKSDYLTNEFVILTKKGIKYLAEPSAGYDGFLINGTRSANGGMISNHDFFSCADVNFYYSDGLFWTVADGRVRTGKTLSSMDLPERGAYPKFIRSTREKIVPCREEIEILDPPAKPQKPRSNIIMNLLPSLGLIATSGVMAAVGGGGMIVYSLISGSMAIVMAVANIVQGNKDYEREVEERKKKYLTYESKKRKEIEQARNDEHEEGERVYTNIAREQTRVSNFSHELFDRSTEDKDFLHIRIGTGSVESIRKINYKKQEKMETDELYEIPVKIAKDYEKLQNAPVVIDLKAVNAVGIVGNISDRYGMLRNILYDLSVRQYPTDYVLYLVVRPEHYQVLSWMRFLPALNAGSITGRNIACDIESRNRIYDQLYAELSHRDEEGKYKHIVVMFYDLYDFLTHPSSKFVKDAKKYGCTFLFMTDSKEEVPMYCDYIVRMDSANKGLVIDSHNINNNKLFTIVPVLESTEKEMVQMLAPVYTDQIALAGTLTQNLTLYELLGIFSADDLDLKKRWERNSAEKSMAAPIGVTSSGKVYLDLHDKAHGPHGLVAGTTGSGKSELLQTYILSIAVNYHPYEVGFVIIDFKGGGMANQFQGLPHLLGTITNMDGKEVERSLKFIKAELERRQRYFGEAGVNHIDKYIKAFKDGKVIEPLPHLVLIVDEFAELRAQQPDFMQELISAARIGRSLGVHLILATQKPSGQVDDQIWSNSRFKLCLKVQDAEDSKEVLKSPVASEIKEPGRAYLQVGNNEIFELFQSAYSGASEKSYESKQKSFAIYDVSASGKRTLAYAQKAGGEEEHNKTQLDALVQYIGDTYKLIDQGILKPVCLPSLVTNIPYSEDCSKIGGKVCIGYCDDPEHQCQPKAMIDIENKHTFVLGSAQQGKTNLLLSMIRSIIDNDSPKESVLYILDFNSTILTQFEGEKHVGGIVTSSQDEKLRNLMKLLEEEVGARKEKMTSAGVGSFAAYREAGFRDLPHIFVIIDNLLAAIELYFDDDESLLRILREGISVGISVIVTASQTRGVAYRYSSSFANNIAFYCNDRDEYTSLFDYGVVGPDEYPGRCIFTAGKSILECQTYMAFSGEREIDRLESMRLFCMEINERFGNEHARKIPFIPPSLTFDMMQEDYNIEFGEVSIPIGLTYQEVSPFNLNFDGMGIMGLCGDKDGIKNDFLRRLFTTIESYSKGGESPYRVLLLDGISHSLESFKQYSFVQTYSLNVEEMAATISPLYEELCARYEKVMNGEELEEQEMILYVIHNNEFAKAIEDDYDLKDKFEEIISKYSGMKVCFIFSDYSNSNVSYSSPSPIVMIKEKQQVLYFEDLSAFKPFDISYDFLRENRKKIEKGDVFFMQGEDLVKLKLAL